MSDEQEQEREPLGNPAYAANVREAWRLQQQAQPNEHRTTRARGDSRYDDEGYRYGVRFRDGSVRSVWNGRTQRERAETEATVLRVQYAGDAEVIEAVRKHWSGDDWEPYQQ